MDIITQNTVISQLFSLLPFDMDHKCSFFDHGAKKLTVAKTMGLLAIAVMAKWPSYDAISMQVRANPYLQQALDLKQISASQLSRKFNEIPTEFFQTLFAQLVVERQCPVEPKSGISKKIGKLGIIDSTSIHVPYSVHDFAKLSVFDSSVKMHLRIVAASPDEVYPDHMIPSTRNYDDREVAVSMVTDPDLTYVMDRGYVKYETMDQWVHDNVRFVMRINHNMSITLLEQREVPHASPILLDAIVRLGRGSKRMKGALRVVEFLDDKARRYRLATTRFDLTAEEIADIYRRRWWIELYFKWMKQHLKLTKLYSTKAQGIWNQLFLALICSLLLLKLQEEQGWRQRTWKVLQAVNAYLMRAWTELCEEMNREASRHSRGRQRASKPTTRDSPPESRVGWIKERNSNPRKRKPRKKT
ncbi:IS4 family transposase [Cohnella hashimotonis]|uniref:IS4 family transposase n=1 Tax=Cohnella hashimotonis TaxID=2826895 RepID=A0ABT6T9R3_9BACL|nr:IS4 family transposase [Cohnella hashimotonis]MDI4648400.1 IS4 family transposase [Cohnella hashimotonis]MDI4648956.1 IS4 family transposase [Cohnella hashimotonis]